MHTRFAIAADVERRRVRTLSVPPVEGSIMQSRVFLTAKPTP